MHPAAPPPAAADLPPLDPTLAAALRRVMRGHWGSGAEFRPLQAESVAATLNKRDALLILPTGELSGCGCWQLAPAVAGRGRAPVASQPLCSASSLPTRFAGGGKSLAFQLAALYRNQITVGAWAAGCSCQRGQRFAVPAGEPGPPAMFAWAAVAATCLQCVAAAQTAGPGGKYYFLSFWWVQVVVTPLLALAKDQARHTAVVLVELTEANAAWLMNAAVAGPSGRQRPGQEAGQRPCGGASRERTSASVALL